jgi:hypothetical protein
LDEARRAHLNVSALAQRAVAEELDRRERMARLDAWLDEMDSLHGAPSERDMQEAEAWWSSAVPADAAPRRNGRGRSDQSEKAAS